MEDSIKNAEMLIDTTNMALTQMKLDILHNDIDQKPEVKFYGRRKLVESLGIKDDIEEFENGLRLETEQLLSKMDEMLDPKRFTPHRRNPTHSKSLEKIQEINKKIEDRKRILEMRSKVSETEAESSKPKFSSRIHFEESKTSEASKTSKVSPQTIAGSDATVHSWANRSKSRHIASDLKSKILETEEIVDRGFQAARLLKEKVEYLARNERKVYKVPSYDKVSLGEITNSKSLEHIPTRTASTETIKSGDQKKHKHERKHEKKRRTDKVKSDENVTVVKVKRLEDEKSEGKKLKFQQLPSLHIKDGLKCQRIPSVDIPPSDSKLTTTHANAAIRNFSHEEIEKEKIQKILHEIRNSDECICSWQDDKNIKCVHCGKPIQVSKSFIDPGKIDKLLMECNFNVFDPRIDEFAENVGRIDDVNQTEYFQESNKVLNVGEHSKAQKKDERPVSGLPNRVESENVNVAEAEVEKLEEKEPHRKLLKIREKSEELSKSYKEKEMQIENDHLKFETVLRRIFEKVDESREFFEGTLQLSEKRPGMKNLGVTKPVIVNFGDVPENNYPDNSKTNAMKIRKPKKRDDDPAKGVVEVKYDEAHGQNNTLKEEKPLHHVRSEKVLERSNGSSVPRLKTDDSKHNAKRLSEKSSAPSKLREKEHEALHLKELSILIPTRALKDKKKQIRNSSDEPNILKTITTEYKKQPNVNIVKEPLTEETVVKPSILIAKDSITKPCVTSPKRMNKSTPKSSPKQSTSPDTSIEINVKVSSDSKSTSSESDRALKIESTSKVSSDVVNNDYESDFEVESLGKDTSPKSEKSDEIIQENAERNREFYKLSTISEADSEVEIKVSESTSAGQELPLELSSHKRYLSQERNPENSNAKLFHDGGMKEILDKAFEKGVVYTLKHQRDILDASFGSNLVDQLSIDLNKFSKPPEVTLSFSTSTSEARKEPTNEMKDDVSEFLSRDFRALTTAKRNFEKVVKNVTNSLSPPNKDHLSLPSSGSGHVSPQANVSQEVVTSLKEVLSELKCQFARTELLADKLTENIKETNAGQTEKAKEKPKSIQGTFLAPWQVLGDPKYVNGSIFDNLQRARKIKNNSPISKLVSPNRSRGSKESSKIMDAQKLSTGHSGMRRESVETGSNKSDEGDMSAGEVSNKESAFTIRKSISMSERKRKGQRVSSDESSTSESNYIRQSSRKKSSRLSSERSTKLIERKPDFVACSGSCSEGEIPICDVGDKQSSSQSIGEVISEAISVTSSEGKS